MPQDYEIIASVSPTSQGGVSIFETTEVITTDNVDEFRSEQAIVASTADLLTSHGFTVLQIGETSISFGGTRKQFQNTFGVKLQKAKREIAEGRTAEAFEPTADESAKLLEMPTEFAQAMEGVAIARPPELFESPLPPAIAPATGAYRYLNVPDDLAVVLRSSRVHRMGGTGGGIKVAMVDTGFYRHPFYAWHGYRVRPTILGPGATGPSDDLIGHGTGEAANIFAAAPDIELIPVKDMFDLGPSDIKGAFDKSVAEKPHIITNSWGFGIDEMTWQQLKNTDLALYNYLKTLEASVANAVSKGIVVCFSAGNRGKKGFPASHPDVIAVGGVHVEYPALDFEASNYASSFDSSLYAGRHVPDVCGFVGRNLGAPGAPLIMLPVQPGAGLDLSNTGASDDGWGLFSGTSAACPQVAGVSALLLERNNTLTPTKVKETLRKSARDIKSGNSANGESAGPGEDNATGAGLVDARWAWLMTLSDVMVAFFEATPEQQTAMIASGALPRVPREFVADMMETLRSV